MAMTLMNYVYWDIPEARVPFIIADLIIGISLWYVEQGVQAKKELEEMKLKHEEQNHETHKEDKRIQKAAVRDEKKQLMKNQKFNGAKINNKPSHNINQPNSKGGKRM